MYSIVAITEDDVENDYETFTILHSFEELDKALEAYNRANSEFDLSLAIIENLQSHILRVVACNDSVLQEYIEDFITVANDNHMELAK
jgi:hypothetical protein